MMKREPASLNYSIVKSSRRTISIIVHPDGSVVVKAPKRVSDRQIREVLNNRKEWIIKHIEKFKEVSCHNPKREFVSGEKHFFMGKEYTLRVNRSAAINGTLNSVLKNGEYIDIWCGDASMAEELMQKWYLSEAKKLLPQIVTPVIEKFKGIYMVSPNKITIKKMKTRWGSCSSRGSISLNSSLIQTPVRCIEYVMIHELCHLIHFKHSKSFYALLAEVIPDWKDRKKELRAILPYDCRAN